MVQPITLREQASDVVELVVTQVYAVQLCTLHLPASNR